MKISEGGGVLHAGPRGREDVCGELGIFGEGGGVKYFFSGPKCPPNPVLGGGGGKPLFAPWILVVSVISVVLISADIALGPLLVAA